GVSALVKSVMHISWSVEASDRGDSPGVALSSVLAIHPHGLLDVSGTPVGAPLPGRGGHALLKLPHPRTNPRRCSSVDPGTFLKLVPLPRKVWRGVPERAVLVEDLRAVPAPTCLLGE